MSDRPDRPPVWVRGGTPYFYHPRRSSMPSEAANEELRRASTSSSIPAISGIAPERSASFSSTSSATAQAAQSPGVASNLFPFATKERSASVSSESESSPGQQGASKRTNSHSDQPYAGLMTQKRLSGDPLYVNRRQSWREQAVGSGPEDRRFLGRWWDNFVKGEKAVPKNK
ncbi:uncharacterized protein GIQ15_04388 [Arthroderma uncinatum]|uniref:uncharacterized protein n=1 Tax=Arthroderma uncinatum TaxID=74035 RepID=UPI00144ACB50|nr:uncharacterized protein GIQ15_04388 [Arthroderma uncinatum]KAF3481629.1 hypothetical protein GIQ15_04388 [Arthroderma uncinatum]